MSAIGDGVPVRGGCDRMRMAVVGQAVGMCPAVAGIMDELPIRCALCGCSHEATGPIMHPHVVISTTVEIMVMTRQRIYIQRRALNPDPRSGVPDSPAGCCGAEADPCFGVSGGDAGSSRFRAACCSGRVSFPRPEDEAVGQVGGAVGAVAQRPACGDGFSRARPHADEAAGDKVELEPLYHLEDVGECHQRTPRRPVKL